MDAPRELHEESLAFVTRTLAELAPHDRPPGCVLDVARLVDGRLVLLEVNTSWGAGRDGPDVEARACVSPGGAP